MNLTFQFRHDPDYWYLDNVSVYRGVTQLLINGDFETGNLSPWTLTSSSSCQSSSGGIVTNSPCTYGHFCYEDGCKQESNFLRQQFNVIAGEMYVISFYLKLGISTGATAFVNVTLS